MPLCAHIIPIEGTNNPLIYEQEKNFLKKFDLPDNSPVNFFSSKKPFLFFYIHYCLVVNLPNSKEKEPYSLLFSSLSHPARRKILRLLAEKPRNFSTILETLGISSSHLTYHLENLGDLLTKLDDGRYKLSPLGDAAVCTMRGVEEPPEAQQRRIKMPLSWKVIFAVLMIGVIVSSALSVSQYMTVNQLSLDYQQQSEVVEQLEADKKQLSIENQRLMSWGTSPTTAVAFLRDVVYLDLTKYVSTLESATVEYRDDLGGIVEELVVADEVTRTR